MLVLFYTYIYIYIYIYIYTHMCVCVCVCVCVCIYIYKTRLASNEIFSTSNKIHGEVSRAKDFSGPPVR